MTGSSVAAVLERVDEIGPVIRENAAESERLGRLTPPVLDALRDAGLFSMLIPLEMGGLGFTIPEFIRVTERVASLDAATGWTLTILADGPLFARFLAPEVYQELCGSPPALIAGSLNPVSARATKVDGGYSFSGVATYLSGSAHAQWIVAAAIVFDGDEPVFTETGIDVRAAAFPIDRARSLDSWNVTGMRATGSTDYEFHDVTVADAWTFEPLRPRPVAGDAFSAIPLWAQLGGSLASCAVGAARNMIEQYVDLALAKVPAGNLTRMAERPPAQIALGEAEGLVQAAAAVLHETVNGVWARGTAQEPFDNPALARQRLGVVTAVRLAAQAVDVLHDAAGMSAVARDSVLDRCWRDVHTMTQHVVLAPARFEVAGRVLLGLDPGSPVI
jgi:indole-3-acetate monooxygenase